jgi:hypothetical protein
VFDQLAVQSNKADSTTQVRRSSVYINDILNAKTNAENSINTKEHDRNN